MQVKYLVHIYICIIKRVNIFELYLIIKISDFFKSRENFFFLLLFS
jgi:hypothetical protein